MQFFLGYKRIKQQSLSYISLCWYWYWCIYLNINWYFFTGTSTGSGAYTVLRTDADMVLCAGTAAITWIGNSNDSGLDVDAKFYVYQKLKPLRNCVTQIYVMEFTNKERGIRSARGNI